MSNVIILSPVREYTFIPEYLDAADTSHFWVRWRFQWALTGLKKLKIPLNQKAWAVDVGCGLGIVKKQYEDVTAWEIDGFDVDYDSLKRAAGAQRGKLYYYDILEKRKEFEEKYEYLFLFDVLEHIDKPIEFLAACRFHLKKEGLIIINVPAMPWLYSSYDEANGHVKRYQKRDLTHELTQGGFSVAYLTFWGFFMVPLAYLRKIFLSKNKSKGQIIAAGFQVRNQIVNKILHSFCLLERMLFSRPPAGTSLMAIARKG